LTAYRQEVPTLVTVRKQDAVSAARWWLMVDWLTGKAATIWWTGTGAGCCASQASSCTRVASDSVRNHSAYVSATSRSSITAFIDDRR